MIIKKYGHIKPNEIKCDHCSAILEYTPHDLKHKRIKHDISYVICPVCGEAVIIYVNMRYKIKLNNENVIEYFTSTSNCRSKRSELITFYCINCDKVHVDYPITDMLVFGEENLITMCRQSYDSVLEPYINL